MAEYIERQTTIDSIKQNQCKNCSDIGLCGNCAVLYAIKIIEGIPAADVAPVKRGMWTHEKDTDWSGGGKTTCSVCKYGYADGAYLDVEDFDYCPHCGAKMED